MTPAHLALAELLAAIDADIGGLDGALKANHIRRFACEWERKLPTVIEAARPVLGAELLREAPVYGLGPERQAEFDRAGAPA